ncbi:hypothetical protein AAC387_Pa07g2511 [Persea americana]
MGPISVTVPFVKQDNVILGSVGERGEKSRRVARGSGEKPQQRPREESEMRCRAREMRERVRRTQEREEPRPEITQGIYCSCDRERVNTDLGIFRFGERNVPLVRRERREKWDAERDRFEEERDETPRERDRSCDLAPG